MLAARSFYRSGKPAAQAKHVADKTMQKQLATSQKQLLAYQPIVVQRSPVKQARNPMNERQFKSWVKQNYNLQHAIFKPPVVVDPRGTYRGERSLVKQQRSPQAKEVDHQTPASVHLPPGTGRSSKLGRQIAESMPSTTLDKQMHRRKQTTGSSNQAKALRNYMYATHVGLVPLARPMLSSQDHYSAALELDIQRTATPRTLFGEPTMHEPDKVPKRQQGVVPVRAALRSIYRQRRMIAQAHQQGHIYTAHVEHLRSVVSEQFRHTALQYAERGLVPRSKL